MKTQFPWRIEQGVSKNLLDIGIKLVVGLTLKRKAWPCLIVPNPDKPERLKVSLPWCDLI